MVGNVGMEEAVMRQISYALKPSLTDVSRIFLCTKFLSLKIEIKF
jgi:hypothetical protein